MQRLECVQEVVCESSEAELEGQSQWAWAVKAGARKRDGG